MLDILLAQAGQKSRAESKTGGEKVYEYLRNGITELRLMPGQMVSIKGLSDHFRVSRSPVRDALIRLETEGLITSLPKRGTLISKIDTKRSDDERFLRMCVEEKIMKLFLEICTDADILSLKQIVEKQRLCEECEDVRGFLELDNAFHCYFYSQTGKAFCFDLVQNNVGHYNRIRLLSCMEKNMLANSIAQHDEIIRLVKDGDSKGLIATTRQHLLKIEQDELELKNKYPALFLDVDNTGQKENTVLKSDFLESIIGMQ